MAQRVNLMQTWADYLDRLRDRRGSDPAVRLTVSAAPWLIPESPLPRRAGAAPITGGHQGMP